MEDNYSLAVVGAGPGGYAAALRASALGMKTLLLEMDSPGGTCLNRGCIPTKTFHYCAYLYGKLKEASRYGLTADNIGFNFSSVQEKKQQVVSQQKSSLQGLLKGEGVEVVSGKARLGSTTCETGGELEIEIDGGGKKKVYAQKVILASGSREIIPEVPGIELPGIMTSRQALELSRLPSSMIVLGGGVIAVEMASIFAGFDVEVTVIQRSRLLRREDKEMVKRLSTYLRRQGINIVTEAPLKEIKTKEDGFVVQVQASSGEQEYFAEKVLVAVGRKPSFQDLNLDAAGVEHHEGGIKVGRGMETSRPGIYAAGDVTDTGFFTAHTAFHQGIVAAENACGKNSYFDGTVVPFCVFSEPQLARAGLTEEQAREKGYSVKVGKFPFSANGKAFLQGEGDGTVKIVGDGETGKLLGVHILGPQASELIQEGSFAVASGAAAEDLVRLIHPHPTLNEAVWEAAMSFAGSSLHQRGR